jgi:hypothetical protein
VSTILVWICEVSILYTAHDLRLTVCACYSCKMALNVGLDASFDNMQMRKKNTGRKQGTRMIIFPAKVSTGVALVVKVFH